MSEDICKRLGCSTGDDEALLLELYRRLKRTEKHFNDMYTVLKWIASFDSVALENAKTLHYDMRGAARAVIERMEPEAAAGQSHE